MEVHFTVSWQGRQRQDKKRKRAVRASADRLTYGSEVDHKVTILPEKGEHGGGGPFSTALGEWRLSKERGVRV